jgi:hypothetical protein
MKTRVRCLYVAERLESRKLLTSSPWLNADGMAALDGGECANLVDARGNIAFAMPTVSPQQAAGASNATLPATAPFSLQDTFRLHSRPTAQTKIYLDFDGHITSNTSWRDARTSSRRIVTPAYDIDGQDGFSTQELLNIQDMWQRVVEDFAPFDVDVTTEAPPLTDLIRSGPSDTRYGIRVVIGGNNRWLGAPAGGVAFLSSYTWNTDTPCFVFPENLGNGAPKFCAEAISHEVGHTLGLNHDGEHPDTQFQSYYPGHGVGPTGWAPIMGVGYYKDLVQWSSGEYGNANNSQDDLAIITTLNGFGYRPDDYGSSFDTASAIDPTTGIVIPGTTQVSFSGAGVIEQKNDVDVFVFSTQDVLKATVKPGLVSPNLDIQMEIWSSVGGLVYRGNPADTLDASVDMTVGAGVYFLSVQGVGKSDVYGGYSDYGSLGQYTFELTVSPIPDAISGPDITASDITLVEGNSGSTDAIFIVSLSEPSAKTVRVSYETVDGTASAADGDYRSVSGVLEFAAGETMKAVVVPVAGDTIGEDDERFVLKLSAAKNGVITTPTVACVIVNDDLPTISALDATVTEGDVGSKTMQIIVRMSIASSETVTVSYATNDITATAGKDYLAVAGTLTFLPGTTEATVSVPILSDVVGEFKETFAFRLSSAVRATLSSADAIGTIVDNDAPTVSVVASVIGESGTNGSAFLQFTVALTSAPTAAATVRYTTVDGTATSRSDFIPTSGTIIFRPNRTTAVIVVRVAGDRLPEEDEFFTLQLSDAKGCTLVPEASSAQGVIVDDDRRVFSVTGPSTPTIEGQNATFTVTLSDPSPLPTTVRYATADGTAFFTRKDYQFTSGSLLFQPGETSKTVTVSTLIDTSAEPSERFQLRLLGAIGATVSKTSGAASAVINDPVRSAAAGAVGLASVAARSRAFVPPTPSTAGGRYTSGFIATGRPGELRPRPASAQQQGVVQSGETAAAFVRSSHTRPVPLAAARTANQPNSAAVRVVWAGLRD